MQIYVFLHKQQDKMNLFLKRQIKSFSNAFRGIKIAFFEEIHIKIHCAIIILVTILGFLFRIASSEWLAIIVCIGLVISSELINTSIENLSDVVTLSKNEQIRKIKDIAAGAVLVTAIISVLVGIIVFLPKIYSLFIC